MKKKYLLMLEGDESDLELSRRYFEGYGIDCHFFAKSNDLIRFLEQQEAEELPQLLLLSMGSVPDTGLEVLKKIKSQGVFRHIPVVILGENTHGKIIRQCYAEGAASYINKPFSDKMADVKIKSFLHYWFEVAEPAGSGRAVFTA